MAASSHLKQLRVGDRVQDTLLVVDVEQREASRGPFTTIILGNCHGQLASAPFWAEEQPRIAGITRGDVAEVIGEVGQHKGRRQLRVTSIRRPSPRLGGLAAAASLRGRREAVLGAARQLARRGPAPAASPAPSTCSTTMPISGSRYQECPASVQGHHAELGGLLRHTCEVASIGRAIGKVCHADLDLVLAGALLHDIGKLEAYSWHGGFGHTESGSLLGHVTLGILMLDRRVGEERPATVYRAGARRCSITSSPHITASSSSVPPCRR